MALPLHAIIVLEQQKEASVPRNHRTRLKERQPAFPISGWSEPAQSGCQYCQWDNLPWLSPASGMWENELT